MKNEFLIKLGKCLVAVQMILLIGEKAYANMVWPALYLETRIFTWWAVAVGLIVEYVFIRAVFKSSIINSIKADVLMNVVSALLGLFLIPICGIILEILPGFIIHWIFKVGTFNPVTWFNTALTAVLINMLIEGIVLKKIFKFEMKRKEYLGLFLANAVSVCLAFVSLTLFPVRM